VVLELAELTTFGAVLGFAINMESRVEKFYEDAAQNPNCSETRVYFASLAEQAKRHRMILERTRRENVAEMILEPITGLKTGDYLTDVKPSKRLDYLDVIRLGLELQRKAERFYLDSSGRISLVEAARIFRRLAKEAAGREAELKALLDKATPADAVA